MNVIVFDYGAGNLHSLVKALALRPGTSVQVESDLASAVGGDALILPGVGAFGAAAARLANGRDEVRQASARGLPILGICLGMQLLFEGSEEGSGRGLGLIGGVVSAMKAQRVPQIGWNTLDDARDPLFTAAPLETA